MAGLLGSLAQWNDPPLADIALFDLGLTSRSLAVFAPLLAHVVKPDWDLPVDRDLRAKAPALRALTVRPFLPRYFPGYDIYLWIDADAWVQERFAVDQIVAAAGGEERFAAVPQHHHAYLHSPQIERWRQGRLEAYFGPTACEAVQWQTYLNAGVFAIKAGAPHWSAWERWFKAGLDKASGKLCCDQTALNHMVWAERLPVATLPAGCNWLCHLAMPEFEVVSEKFCEPTVAQRPIGILHLTGNTKNQVAASGAGSTRATAELRFRSGRSQSAPDANRLTGLAAQKQLSQR